MQFYQEGNEMTKTAEALDEMALRSLLEELPGWIKMPGRDAITITYGLADFPSAIGLMADIAPEAEALNHHPELFNVYNKLTVTLTTHDLGGLSTLDAALARLIHARALAAGASVL